MNYYRRVLFVLIAEMYFLPAFSQITVFNAHSFQSNGSGECQSAVIMPGLKSDCPKGRILVSRDNTPPPNTGAVTYRDLDKPNMTPVEATFENPPVPDIMGNDHDLIALPNGDVLYISAGSSKAPLNPKPGWFDNTFRDAFGPGARSSIMTWRSSDGGKSFKYISRYDPATVENGIPAYPDVRRNALKQRLEEAPWDMGGTDGPLVNLVPGTDILYMTTPTRGYFPKNGDLKNFVPDTNMYVNKTLLLTSKGGNTWTSLGFIDLSSWRVGIVPFYEKDKTISLLLAHGFSNAVFTGNKADNLKYAFTDATPSPNSFCWTDNASIQALKKFVSANIWAHTVISRCPGEGNNMLVVYPSMFNQVNGCAAYFYNQKTDDFLEADPILPEEKSPTNCIFHPTIIDTKTGPLLLYWYDLNSKTMRGKIRGRIINQVNDYSPDFDISTFNNKAYSFDLKTACWYGDYHTADGFTEPAATIKAKDFAIAHFYPIWIQPDQTIRYAEVSYKYEVKRPFIKIGKLPNINIQVWPRPLRPWIKNIPHVRLNKVISAKEMSQLEKVREAEDVQKIRVIKKDQNLRQIKVSPTKEIRPIKQ